MGVVIVTTVVLSLAIYVILGAVSVGVATADYEPTCSNRDFMNIEQWLLGMGVGHLACFAIVGACTILAFTKDIVWPLILFEIAALVYVLVYTILGAIVLSISKYCLIVKHPIWILSISDIVINLVLILASLILIPFAVNDR